MRKFLGGITIGQILAEISQDYTGLSRPQIYRLIKKYQWENLFNRGESDKAGYGHRFFSEKNATLLKEQIIKIGLENGWLKPTVEA